MCKIVNTAKDLGKAIANGESRIIITGKIGDAVIRIEAIGPVAWAVVLGGIGTAIAGVCLTAGSGGAAAPAGTVMHFVSVPAVLAASGGISTATVLVGIAAAGTGIGTLRALRTYRAEREGDHVVLTKR